MRSFNDRSGTVGALNGLVVAKTLTYMHRGVRARLHHAVRDRLDNLAHSALVASHREQMVGNSQERIDLMMDIDGRRYYIDCAFTCLYRASLIDDACTQAGGAAITYAKTKHEKYDRLLPAHGTELVALVADMMGAWCPEAQKFLGLLASKYAAHFKDRYTEKGARFRFFQNVSTSLHRKIARLLLFNHRHDDSRIPPDEELAGLGATTPPQLEVVGAPHVLPRAQDEEFCELQRPAPLAFIEPERRRFGQPEEDPSSVIHLALNNAAALLVAAAPPGFVPDPSASPSHHSHNHSAAVGGADELASRGSFEEAEVDFRRRDHDNDTDNDNDVDDDDDDADGDRDGAGDVVGVHEDEDDVDDDDDDDDDDVDDDSSAVQPFVAPADAGDGRVEGGGVT